MNNSKLPNLIIAGVHKAATTSLFTYLKSHPEVFGSGKKEVHYFTPLRYGKPLQNLQEYKKYFTDATNETYLLEASPSYMYGASSIINKMKEILPPHRVIIILRDPIQRFISFYCFLKAQLFLDSKENMLSFLNKSLESYDVFTDDHYNHSIREGEYINYLPDWFDNYRQDLKIIYFEEFIAQPQSVMVELAEWLKIDPFPFKKMEYTAENKTIYAQNKQLHTVALLINNKFENFWRNNQSLKIKLRNIYYAINKNKNQKKEYDEISLCKLKEVYEEPNKRLKLYFQQKELKLPAWL